MYTLPALNYDYESLSPYISKNIMELHHQKHHQGYIDKLNKALEVAGVGEVELDELIMQIDNLPADLADSVIKHGGGHYNHSQFWQWLTPDSEGEPSGVLAKNIEIKYGNFQNFVDSFTSKSMSVFGSGWVWLMPDLSITTTPNQENPLMHGGPAPILGNDIWEHAYYLDYQNRRDEYLKAWWNVVNWDRVAELYQSHI